MNMPNFKRSAVVFAAALLLGGCEDLLTVQNPNNGDTEKVLATPEDAENLLGSYYKRWHAGLNAGVGLYGMASVMSFENYSSLANNCMNNHTPFTGATNFNTPGNTCQGDQFRAFQFNSEVNKLGAIFLKKFEVEGFSLGSAARDLRAQAFANFLVGLSVGYNALVYDSIAMANAATGGLETTPFIHYTAARDSMVVYMDKAITLATGGLALPSNWIPSTTTMSAANFVRLIRSYRARMLAYMARNPAERAAADWAMIDADAAAGITSDFNIITSSTEGPTHTGWRTTFTIVSGSLWHQMPPFYIGMADSSGTYATWIGEALGDRGAGNVGLLIRTEDLRFPQGATRAAQQADFNLDDCDDDESRVDCRKRYFLNRATGEDQYTGAGWGFSNYDYARHIEWDTYGTGGSESGDNGPTLDMSLAEMNLLRAEAAYRAGSYGPAATFVNLSRAAAGLPDAPGDAVSQVPAGVSANSCVPKVPVAPGFNTIACGTLWDALIYERYIETIYTSYLGWYFDARGLGLLAENMPVMWATPYNEIQARGLPGSHIYGTGPGAGNLPGSWAGPSLYGWEVPR